VNSEPVEGNKPFKIAGGILRIALFVVLIGSLLTLQTHTALDYLAIAVACLTLLTLGVAIGYALGSRRRR
jgi:hydrogenase/urease accessory protein HupE